MMNTMQDFMKMNPFMDAFKNNNMFNVDVQKMFEQFLKMNPFSNLCSKFTQPYGMNESMSSLMCGVEAIMEAAQMMSNSAQNVIKKKAHMMQEQASSLFNHMKEMHNSSNPEVSMAKQSQYMKHSFESMVSEYKEICSMMSSANMEAYEHLNKKISKAMSGVHQEKCCH